MAQGRDSFDPIRRAVLGGLLSGVASAAMAGAPPTSLRPRPRGRLLPRRAVAAPETLIEQAKISGQVSFAVADADTGEILETRSPLLRQPPASVAKTVTTLYALETLGPAYRFQTRLVATGPVEEGAVKGDLVLQGGGDPTLDTDALAALARDLKSYGIERVAGRFLVDASALPDLPHIDPGQPNHVGYNPAISGLNLNFNRVFFEWKRGAGGYDLTMDARSARYRPRVSIAQMEVVDRAHPVYTYSESAGRDAWTVSKKALGSGGGRWLPVRRPGGYAGEVFHTIARAEGIALSKPTPGQGSGAVLAQHSSAELSVILQDLLKYSTNLTAETVGLTATRARGAPDGSLAASARAMSDWAIERHAVRHMALVDHSGLGPDSRVSARAMLQMLLSSGWDGPLRPLLKPVRFKDERGRPMRNHPVEAVAKTGTLNFVSGLAGYFQVPGGRRMAFAIFAADLPRRAAIPPQNRERPPGARPWAVRARALQQDLIERWAQLYGA